MPINPKEELKALLRELFQLDKTDLDFGIYRIMNLRSKDVEDFIDNKLPATLKTVTDKLAVKGKEEASAELDEAKEKLKKHIENDGEPATTNDELNAYAEEKPNAPVVKKYLEAKKSVTEITHSKDLEIGIYNDLYTFFNRYYEEGDFISKPRAGEHTYMIPYNGEEVKFHWANRDQYYIKTGENFRNYAFKSEPGAVATGLLTASDRNITVEFRLIDAETATNNNQNKKGRLFVPATDWFHWDGENRKLELHFEYKVPSAEEKEKWGDKQSVKKDNKGINEQLVSSHLDERIKATGDAFLIRFWESEKTVKIKGTDESIGTFYYHLNRYTATNSFDYFIHKDLRRFLMQELDYYLKHDIFTLNFLGAEISQHEQNIAIRENVLRASAIRSIAVEIIDFLAELENFQKMLFEKKKFVVQSDYCLTLDLIPAEVIDEVITFVLNDPEKKQLTEWQNLGFIETTELSAEDIKADKYLVLDTQFLSVELKFKVLGGIESLDEKGGGLLISSDNFQALAFLGARYNRRIKSMYIDPPYNTSASEIVYKNSYKHSSWIAMIQGRAASARKLINDEGVFCAAIDDAEFINLKAIINEVFFEENLLAIVAVRSNPHGRAMASGFSQNHEYALFYGKSELSTVGRLPRDEKRASRYAENDDSGNFTWMNFRTTGANSRKADRPKLFYPVFVSSEGEIRISSFSWQLSLGWVPDEAKKQSESEIYPKDSSGAARVWNLGWERAKTVASTDLEARKIGDDWQIYRKYRPNMEGALPATWWDDAKYSATESGTRILKDLFGEREGFSYPKSVFLVEDCLRASSLSDGEISLDFFAGSGTTGHAVINLNREDEGNRKYILIEMGEYFDTVTKPRIQKVVYSKDWKAGKPVRDNKPLIQDEGKSTGISHIFQYLKLEQYEDSLNNIEFEAKDAPAAFSFADQIKYTLRKGTKDSASLMNIARFADPFNYEMDILKLNERVPTKVDLVTTFNFLLGIDVSRYRVFNNQNRDYHIVHGKRGTGEYIIVWRKLDDTLDLESERDWIKQQEWYSDEGVTVYCNADNAFGAQGIEAEFRTLMFADVDY